MKSHLDILTEKTSLCMCEVEKKISDYLGQAITFNDDGDFQYSDSSKKINDEVFNSFLASVKK